MNTHKYVRNSGHAIPVEVMGSILNPSSGVVLPTVLLFAHW